MGLSNNSPTKEGGSTKGFWTAPRVLLTLVVVGLLSALGLSSCNSNEGPTNAPANRVTTAPDTNAPPATNAPPVTNAPPAAFVSLPQNLRDTKLQTLDGESLKLADFADKVLIVNIWATWCGPCRQEMPELVKMNNEYKSRGLVVLGLATTYNEHNDQAHVKDFIRAQNINYRIVWDDGTMAAPLVQLVQGQSVIPQSFVISRDGHIVRHFQGFNPYSTPQLMRQAVEDALNAKGKA
ncbi:MAG TPA: TlpA disulfide reductase family protein [Pyrinomonadaceae bacterium]|nr:TlpA disulfide reductase family protein [Pyrinomonadaceae bacterium]